jgi:GNAT superfamily N-acetyltransferase
MILRRDLTKPMPDVVAGVPLEMYVASRSEVLEEVAGLVQPPNPWHLERFAHRLDNGFVCFVGRVEGKLVAMNWTQHDPGVDEGMYVDLRPDEVVCLHAYTAEAYRGRNIHAALLREMLLHSEELGYRYAYARIKLTNRRSQKAHQRLRWERTGRAIVPIWQGGPGGPVVRLSGSVHPWYRLRPGDDHA